MRSRPPKPTDMPAAPRYRERRPSIASPISPILRNLIRKSPSAEALTQSIEESGTANDRGCAILLSAHVEQAVEQLIIVNLKNNDANTIDILLSQGGALSGFYAKIHLGFAMGLYNEKARDVLDATRRIRNAFAHSPAALTFATPEVAAEIAKYIPDPPLDTNFIHRPGVERNRFLFFASCWGMYMAFLLIRAHDSKNTNNSVPS